MVSSKRIKSKLLRLFWCGDQSKVHADWRGRIRRILAALHAAVSPEELNIPGYRWHMLKGNRQGEFSVSVSGNWRITYKWDQQGPYDIDLEDYHG